MVPGTSGTLLSGGQPRRPGILPLTDSTPWPAVGAAIVETAESLRDLGLLDEH
jgi:hypothetical protein